MLQRIFVLSLIAATLSAAAMAQEGNLADAGIYWCPMRGAPCQIEDYHAAGPCRDCGMPLVTKTAYLKMMANVEKNAQHVGILLYPGFELLDVFGPVEMWAYVPNFKIHMIAQEAGPVSSGQGVEVIANHSFESAPKLDILMVPGGAGTYGELKNEALLAWLRERAAEAEITTSVCSGSALLAKAGVLDGHKATSNKQFFKLAMDQSDEVDWVWQARWVDDGPVITSSGVSAGMDMALHLVQRVVGEAAAIAIAEGTEYEWHRDPTVDPFAEIARKP